MTPLQEKREAEKEARRLEREADKMLKEAEADDEDDEPEEAEPHEDDRAEKVAHMKEVKRQVKEKAIEDAENMDAYVMLSFDTFANKAGFLERFGYPAGIRFIKGEEFDGMVERID